MTPQVWDVVIVGAGPTGLAAALYTAREDLSTLVLEAGVVGGLIATTEHVENYPGFNDGIGGIALSEQMEAHAKRFGATVRTGVKVSGLKREADGLVVTTSGGEIQTRTVLIATGSEYKKLGTPGETEFTGRGVHYCATCDGPLYRDKHLVIVGGGNTALQEGLFLTKFASRITMLVRGPKLGAAEVLQKPMLASPKVDIRYGTTLQRVEGQGGRVSSVTVRHEDRDEKIDADGVFVFIGLNPNTDWVDGTIDLDERGFVKVDQYATSLSGVFAAGDVQPDASGQVATAVGEGVAAALAIRRYLDPALHKR